MRPLLNIVAMVFCYNYVILSLWVIGFVLLLAPWILFFRFVQKGIAKKRANWELMITMDGEIDNA